MANDEPMSEEWQAKLREMLAEYYAANARKSTTPAGIPVRLWIADDIVSQAVEPLLAEIDRLRAAHNQAWDLIDQLSEDLADHAPIAHDWLIDDANAWRAAHPKTKRDGMMADEQHQVYLHPSQMWLKDYFPGVNVIPVKPIGESGMKANNEPLSDERLAEIRGHLEKPAIMSQTTTDSEAWPIIQQAWRDRAALLAEVDRLRAENVWQYIYDRLDTGDSLIPTMMEMFKGLLEEWEKDYRARR